MEFLKQLKERKRTTKEKEKEEEEIILIDEEEKLKFIREIEDPKAVMDTATPLTLTTDSTVEQYIQLLRKHIPPGVHLQENVSYFWCSHRSFTRIQGFNKYIFPVITAAHFGVFVVEKPFDLRQILLYDSLPGYLLQNINWVEIMATINQILKLPKKTTWKVVQQECPQQDNSIDCGIFTMFTTRQLLLDPGNITNHPKAPKGKRNISASANSKKAKQVNILREHFAKELMEKTMIKL